MKMGLRLVAPRGLHGGLPIPSNKTFWEPGIPSAYRREILPQTLVSKYKIKIKKVPKLIMSDYIQINTQPKGSGATTCRTVLKLRNDSKCHNMENTNEFFL